MELNLNNLKQAFSIALPGKIVQYSMAPVDRMTEIDDSLLLTYKRSAVCIVILKDEDLGYYIPLIKRTSDGGVHSGQISLPGGKQEEGDKTFFDTATRECFEEIGIKPEISLGELSPLYIPVSKFMVQPVVCYYENEPRYQLQVNEVEALIKLPLKQLSLFEKKINNEELNYIKKNAPYYEIEGFKVWGATAMILAELKEILKNFTF